MADVQGGRSKIPCLRGLFTVTSVGHYLVVSKEVQGEEVMMVGVARESHPVFWSSYFSSVSFNELVCPQTVREKPQLALALSL